MKKRDVNLGHTDENIADQYDNLCEGLQKDAGQNSWDARLTSKGKNWKLAFTYHPLLNCLTLEDFGTCGMNSKRWKEYQSLWDTTKAQETALGARGQGKFLFHYFASGKLVLTESLDEGGIYRFSFGTTDEYDDETGKLSDFIPSAKPLDHQGARIWIMDLKPDLRDELLDCKEFMSHIAKTWWEIIRNWNISFMVNLDSIERKVELPQLPTIEKEKVFTNEKISDLGRIKNLTLRFCKGEVPEYLRGVAVQRGGMTIIRLPISADEMIKNKIYGSCTFDEALELELKKVEFPNHFGFASKRAWNHVREYIRRKSEEFVQEISPVKKKEVTALPQDLIQRAVRIVNDLVREYAPELAMEATGPGGKKPKPEEHKTKQPPEIRIDTFRGNARKLEYDESLITECELINDTTDEVKVLFQMEIRHEEGDLKFNPKYTIKLAPNTPKGIDIPLVDFQENIDKSGEYKATAVLTDSSGKELHKRSFTLYLHEEPPPPKGKVFLSTMVFSNGKGTPLERKRHLPVTERGALRIIFDHPDFVHARGLVSSKKAKLGEILIYSIKCGVDEAIEGLLELRYNESQLNTDEIRVIRDKRDAMYYYAVLNALA
jgi:hypothetical protein